MITKIFKNTLCWFTLISLIPLTAFSENHSERDHWHGDIRFFHEHDHVLWRSGHWYHGLHAGRPGWWWVVNGVWYFYPRKVALIPDPYLPPTVTVVQAAPPTVVMQQPGAQPVIQPVQVQQPSPSAPPSWYYCNNPHGYYPYVTNCPGGWVSVPATPPPPPSQ